MYLYLSNNFCDCHIVCNLEFAIAFVITKILPENGAVQYSRK